MYCINLHSLKRTMAQASCECGVRTPRVRKAEEVKQRQIEVKAA